MYLGSVNWCLRVKNLEEAVRFYTSLGLERVEGVGGGEAALMRRGSFSLYLMHQFGGDSMNFRGADAFEVFEHMRREGWTLDGKPEPTQQPGTAWMTHDPDGHGIFFNTAAHETTPAYREAHVSQVLRNTERDLVDLGASEECLRAFREQILARFATAAWPPSPQ